MFRWQRTKQAKFAVVGLLVMALVVFGVAMYRFRRELAPKRVEATGRAADETPDDAAVAR